MTYQKSGIPIHLNHSMSIYVHEVVLGVFQLESCEDFHAIISRSFAKIITKYVMSIRPFCSLSYVQIVYITIM